MAAVLVGCGPGVSDSDDDGGAGDSATEGNTDSNGDSDTNIGSTTVPDTAGNTTNGDDTVGDTVDPPDTDGDDVCELPANETPGGSSATISIRNDSDSIRYIAPYTSVSCNYTPFEIFVGGESVLWDHEGVYPGSAEFVCGYGCSDGSGNGYIINPGGELAIEWNGGVWNAVDLDPACQEGFCDEALSEFDPTAVQVLQFPEAMEYSVRFHVFDTCPEGSVEASACDCNDLVCDASFYEPYPGDYTIEGGAVFPEGVELVLE